MVFSSNLFVFGFMPIFFIIYYLLPRWLKNIFILAASLFFYEFGAGQVVFILLISIIFNYIAGRIIETTTFSAGLRRCILWVAIAANLAFLFFYKYVGFFWDVMNTISSNMLLHFHIERPEVLLPIGISFFTFQAISYLYDIYTCHCRSAPNLFDFGMYHSLFPQLIAGPIVRYAEIETKIRERNLSFDMVVNGLSRFAIGLAKKTIIADQAGSIADAIFNLSPTHLSASHAWLGAIAYTIQIFFDFSGYSDMAIGLGMLLGFRFPENFNHPYRCQNITEFWRSWHMTLSRWFRDYVYIPLGGNRKGIYRTYFNLLIVFFLCGLWHGAGYTFVIWGLFHGGLLMAERYLLHRWNFVPSGLIGRSYTLFMVIIGWVFFRAPTVSYASSFLTQMSFLGNHNSDISNYYSLVSREQLFFLVVGIILALIPLHRLLFNKNIVVLTAQRATTLMLYIYSMALLAAHTYNPFLYFRF